MEKKISTKGMQTGSKRIFIAKEYGVEFVEVLEAVVDRISSQGGAILYDILDGLFTYYKGDFEYNKALASKTSSRGEMRMRTTNVLVPMAGLAELCKSCLDRIEQCKTKRINYKTFRVELKEWDAEKEPDDMRDDIPEFLSDVEAWIYNINKYTFAKYMVELVDDREIRFTQIVSPVEGLVFFMNTTGIKSASQIQVDQLTWDVSWDGSEFEVQIDYPGFRGS